MEQWSPHKNIFKPSKLNEYAFLAILFLPSLENNTYYYEKIINTKYWSYSEVLLRKYHFVRFNSSNLFRRLRKIVSMRRSKTICFPLNFVFKMSAVFVCAIPCLVEGRLRIGVQHHPAVHEVQRHRADGLEGEAVQSFLVQL